VTEVLAGGGKGGPVEAAGDKRTVRFFVSDASAGFVFVTYLCSFLLQFICEMILQSVFAMRFESVLHLIAEEDYADLQLDLSYCCRCKEKPEIFQLA
jgi:hypothetical protein